MIPIRAATAAPLEWGYRETPKIRGALTDRAKGIFLTVRQVRRPPLNLVKLSSHVVWDLSLPRSLKKKKKEKKK